MGCRDFFLGIRNHGRGKRVVAKAGAKGLCQVWILWFGLSSVLIGSVYSCSGQDKYSDNQSILPLTASGRVDTARLPRMRLGQDTVDLGILPWDTTYVVRIPIYNVGDQPLIIQRAWSPGACGCVVSSVPRDTIPVGASAFLEVRLHTEELAPGRFMRVVYVVSNAFPNVRRVVLIGVVDTARSFLLQKSDYTGTFRELKGGSVSLRK